jgi:hypothetical protein
MKSLLAQLLPLHDFIWLQIQSPRLLLSPMPRKNPCLWHKNSNTTVKDIEPVSPSVRPHSKKFSHGKKNYRQKKLQGKKNYLTFFWRVDIISLIVFSVDRKDRICLISVPWESGQRWVERGGRSRTQACSAEKDWWDDDYMSSQSILFLSHPQSWMGQGMGIKLTYTETIRIGD